MPASSRESKPGRPAKISRKDVLETAFTLVRDRPISDMSMRQLATELNISPGSIYRYFDNKDALMMELAEIALASLPHEIPESGSWRDRLEEWLINLREGLRRFPQMLGLIAASGQESKAVLEMLKVVAEVLEEEGLDRVYAIKVAQGLLWQVIGFLVVEEGAVQTDPLVDRYSDLDGDPLAEIARNVETRNFDALYEIVISISLAGIAVELGQSLH